MKAKLILCVCRIHYVFESRQKVIGGMRPAQKDIEQASNSVFFVKSKSVE
jgi:hypothetical protein